MSIFNVGDGNLTKALSAVEDLGNKGRDLASMLSPERKSWAFRSIGPKFRKISDDTDRANQLYFALTNPIPGEEANFHRWYETIHVPEVIEHLPEYYGAQRYARVETKVDSSKEWEFLTIYNVRSSDVPKMLESIPVMAVQKFHTLESILPGSGAATWSPIQ
jgi:hypothetical protein